MSIIQGFKAKAGIYKETSWGAYEEPTDLIPLVSEGITSKREILERKSLVGKAGQETGMVDVYSVSGSLSCDLTFQDCDILIAAAMGGGAGTPTGTGPYTHTIDLADDISRSLSITILKMIDAVGQIDYKIAGAKFTRMTIKGEVKSLLSLEFDVIGKSLQVEEDSGINWSSLGLSGKPYIPFTSLSQFNLQPWSGAPPFSEPLSSFELTLDNKLKTDDYDSSSGLYIAEPVRNDKREVTFKIGFPRHDKDFAENLRSWHENQTQLQATLEFKNGAYIFRIEMPNLLVVEPPQGNIGGGSIVPAEATLKAYVNEGNTNMPDISNEFRITIVNDRSTRIW